MTGCCKRRVAALIAFAASSISCPTRWPMPPVGFVTDLPFGMEFSALQQYTV
jgi:hypothetical protein